MNTILIQIGVQIHVKACIFETKSEDMNMIPVQIDVNICIFEPKSEDMNTILLQTAVHSAVKTSIST